MSAHLQIEFITNASQTPSSTFIQFINKNKQSNVRLRFLSQTADFISTTNLQQARTIISIHQQNHQIYKKVVE